MGLHLLIADIHATRHPPSRCTETYWPDLLDLLTQTTRWSAELDVITVTWAGDTFHHKGPSRTDHGLIMDLQKVIRAYSCKVLAVAGNHDMRHDRIESVRATQPLGVLLSPDGLTELDGWSFSEGQEGGYRNPFAYLYGVPWLQHWSEEAIFDALRRWREPELPMQPALVVTHAPIYPPGQEPRYEGAEFTPAQWWADAMGNQGSVFYGHIHEPHGEFEAGGVAFCNNGALSRGSLDDYNLERTPGFTLWDDGTGAFSFMPLHARPGAEVFLAEEAAQEAARAGRLGAFRADLARVSLPRLSVEGVIAEIKGRGLGREVEDLAEELLTAAAHEGRKS
jgi:DNA repair exonuclease SbcCD nuclease subunit